jgi:hypothetical protein
MKGMKMARLFAKLNYLVTIPISLVILLNSRRVHSAYRLNWWKRVVFGLRVVRNKHGIQTGTSYKTALAMALKLFELPPEVPGVMVECGTY